MKFKLVDTEHILWILHVKACANSKKMRKRVAHEQALWYEQELKEEIQKDRAAHGKKPLKDNDKMILHHQLQAEEKVLQMKQNLRFRKEQNTKVQHQRSGKWLVS